MIVKKKKVINSEKGVAGGDAQNWWYEYNEWIKEAEHHVSNH